MGACLSCFRTGSEYDAANNETSPLLSGFHGDEQANQITPFDADRIQRENELNAIVDMTGRSLIDLMSVQRPEVNSIGRSAKEYRHLLAGGSAATGTGNDPDTSFSSIHTLNTLKKWPKSVGVNTAKKPSPPAFFRELAQKADHAVAQEPNVSVSEPLLEMFNPVSA